MCSVLAVAVKDKVTFSSLSLSLSLSHCIFINHIEFNRRLREQASALEPLLPALLAALHPMACQVTIQSQTDVVSEELVFKMCNLIPSCYYLLS